VRFGRVEIDVWWNWNVSFGRMDEQLIFVAESCKYIVPASVLNFDV